jgi:hypothetical protein
MAVHSAQERKLIERRALDLRERAARFRTSAEGARSAELRRTLLDAARESDDQAAKIEAQLTAAR